MSYRSFHTTAYIIGHIAFSALILTKSAFGQGDTIRPQFFDTLAISLRADYRLCTADSTELPLAALLRWRQSIDSAAADTGYPRIVRKFTESTGIRVTDARPCEIIEWMRGDASRMEDAAQLLAAERDSALQMHDDSMFLISQLSGVKRQGYDFAGIPFGLPMRAILLFTRNEGIELTMSDTSAIIIDPFVIGKIPCRIALHLSKADKYAWYEMESGTCGPDSLDTWARPQMDQLAAEIEKRTAMPPTHIYRVGRFDIVPGRLAICKLWEFPEAFAYIGLARMNNRFYAKAIIRQK